jgi:hypothetical protein
VTFIVKNLTDSALESLAAMPDAQRFDKLKRWAFGDLRHCVSQKVGSGAFRDRVELNQIMRAPRFVSYKLEARRGYRLATFNIERAP